MGGQALSATNRKVYRGRETNSYAGVMWAGGHGWRRIYRGLGGRGETASSPECQALWYEVSKFRILSPKWKGGRENVTLSAVGRGVGLSRGWVVVQKGPKEEGYSYASGALERRLTPGRPGENTITNEPTCGRVPKGKGR